jgi:hypothetical protein
MFFKPKFCCNCGEKINRTEWRPWTSRRFCDLCETEFKGEQLFLTAGAGACILIGVLGMAGLFSGKAPDNEIGVSSQPTRFRQESMNGSGSAAMKSPSPLPAENTDTSAEQKAAEPMASPLPETKKQPARTPVSSDRPAYFCGATTKKGTPCSRRVKAKGLRCWQHDGD